MARAVVDNGTVITCIRDGQPTEGAKCLVGVPLDAVNIAPVKDGPIVLTVTRSLSSKELDNEPCDWLVSAISKGPPQQIAVGRAMTVLPPTNETYRKIVSEAVGVPNITVTGLVRVDLEGDGTDEILFSADSHPEGFPYGEVGLSYAIVGVRRVTASDEPETVILFEHKGQMSGESPMDHLSVALMGVTDLEGDGRLEVVFSDSYYEGSGWNIARIEEGRAVALGGAGCGV